jgi:O-antigen/teichoic acid export membrane protein
MNGLSARVAGFIKPLIRHQGVQRYALNTGWIFAEYFFRAVVGLLVGVYVARYLGPESYGVFNYILSVVGIFAVIGRLGLDGILTRELVQRPLDITTDLGTAFWMMVCSALVNLVLLAAVMSIFERNTHNVYFAVLAGGSMIFQAFNIVDMYFQSRVEAKYVTICRVVGLATSSCLKILAVLSHASLLLFFAIFMFEAAFLALLYMVVGRSKGLPGFFSSFSGTRAKKLILSSWPLIFTALAITFYMKLDQIMIKSMLGEREVGIYSAAVRIYDAWVMIPYLVSVSLLPAIIKSKSLDEGIYHQRLVYLFRFLFWLSVFVAIIVVIFSRPIILYSFGPAFQESTSVLAIVIFTTAWAALGSGSARYLVVEGMEKKIAVRTITTAVVNGLLNLLLIPRMGIQGAAVATLVCTFVGNYLMDWFDPDLKTLLAIKHRAIFFIK